MTAQEIIDQLATLTDAERRRILIRLRALTDCDSAVPLPISATASSHTDVNLQEMGMSKLQAADLRARLQTFAEDWDREEASVYDEHPSR